VWPHRSSSAPSPICRYAQGRADHNCTAITARRLDIARRQPPQTNPPAATEPIHRSALPQGDGVAGDRSRLPRLSHKQRHPKWSHHVESRVESRCHSNFSTVSLRQLKRDQHLSKALGRRPLVESPCQRAAGCAHQTFEQLKQRNDRIGIIAGSRTTYCCAAAVTSRGRSVSQPPPNALYNATRFSETVVVLSANCCCVASKLRSATSTVRKSATPCW
jgi:hypothetical protein